MLTIGLTGGIGSGKSTVAQFFAELNIEIIDTDLIAREVITPEREAFHKIVVHFGATILNQQQQIDRKKLREIIFADSAQKKWLENLLHPLIRIEVKKRITQVKSPYCMVVIPLLAESSDHSYIDRILVVDCPEEQQIRRAQKRDQISATQVEAVIKAQATRTQRLAIADDIIYNDSDLENLKNQVIKLHQFYLSLQ